MKANKLRSKFRPRKPRWLTQPERYTQRGLARAIGGIKAKKRGKMFEDELEVTCDTYRELGVGIFSRGHPPVGGPPGHLFYLGRGQVDFVGLWKGPTHSVPIAFDAKSVSDHLPMTYRWADRDLFQVRWLRDFARGGGVAFCLLRSGDEAAILLDVETLAKGDAVPVRARQERGGTASQRLVPIVRRGTNGVIVWDFLKVLADALDGGVSDT